MIPLKTAEEIQIMREANRIVGEVLKELKRIIRPGINTSLLDRKAEEGIRKRGAIPAFKGYRGYPAVLCVSVNEEVVHGIPGRRILREGDIVSLDLGVKYRGFYGDAAVTLPVGKISEKARKLLQTTRNALYQAIEKAIVGNYLGDISWAIQSYVEKEGFQVVRDFVGHGIGENLHEEPQIPNFGNPGTGPRLEEGMVLAIEPMVNEGTWEVKILEDGWTAVTLDGSLSAHFEHTVAVTRDGPYILSQEWEEE